jgi:hypothetical protein
MLWLPHTFAAFCNAGDWELTPGGHDPLRKGLGSGPERT